MEWIAVNSVGRVKNAGACLGNRKTMGLLTL
ncbi:hypothetical protein EDC63_107100 [Sulfurirhabdus autotrophica]|uniref:Uncharacterized protein n=1 Tax=Sulfurirhabdus autotrophica TaxID=1706046 RepID=A0A4R3Y4D2_9PROT|nr:hypothetical protein EDC63_107100 [Sulfurirhabdus autotrophica]